MIINERKTMEDTIYNIVANLYDTIHNNGSNDELKAEMIRSGFLLIASTNYKLCVDHEIISIDNE